MGRLAIMLNKDIETEREFYIFPKNISDITQVNTITYGKKIGRLRRVIDSSSLRLYVNASKDMAVLRREVVDREYEGIENLVEGIKSGEIKYSENEKRFVKCQRK